MANRRKGYTPLKLVKRIAANLFAESVVYGMQGDLNHAIECLALSGAIKEALHRKITIKITDSLKLPIGRCVGMSYHKDGYILLLGCTIDQGDGMQ